MTLTALWESFGSVELVAIVLGWVVAFGMLAISYARSKRWNPEWKERWERRHGTSLRTLRGKLKRTLTVTLVVRWIMLAVLLMSIGFSLGPIIDVIKGLQSQPVLVVVEFAGLNLIVLLVLALLTASVKLLRYRLGRISELLASEPQHY